MKPLGEAARKAEKAIRHKRWQWCRLWNGFTDMPLWRLVAGELGLPLHQVVAFVVRLDAIANAAEQRGQVDHFRADEFAIALGMPADDARRIYAALEQERWVEYGAVADFFNRNRDEEKEDQNVRKQRSRERQRVRELLARLERLGRITPAEHLDLALGLKDLDDGQLAQFLTELRRLELSTGSPVTKVTTVTSDRVTVTPEQTTGIKARAVDNSGTSARGGTEGLSGEEVVGAQNDPQAQARQWMEIEGRRIAITRMPDEQPGRVDTLLERWRDQDLEGDAVALMTVLIECDRLALVGASFHVAVSNRCNQHRQRAQLAQDKQPNLPLGGIQPVKRTA